MANVQQIIAAGVQFAQYAFLDSNGIIAGTTGTVTAGANGSPMGQIYGIQEASATVPDPDVVSVPGDDGTMGTFIFDSTSTPSFTIDVGVHDLGIDAYAQGTNVVTDGDFTYGVLQPTLPAYRDALLILTSRGLAQDSAVRGTSEYYHYILPKVTMHPLGRVAIAGRTEAAFRYQCVEQVSTTRGAGATMRVGTGYEGTEAATILPTTSLKLATMQRWDGDGATTTFNLAKTPYSTSLTYNRIRVNGLIQLSGVTINATNKTITFSVAPANGLPIVATYQFVNS